jgi:hypothetical protein
MQIRIFNIRDKTSLIQKNNIPMRIINVLKNNFTFWKYEDYTC